MRFLLPFVFLLVTGAGAGYGDIDAPRDTDPLTLGQQFCSARIAGDMSALEPYYAPKLQRVLAAAIGVAIPWQSRDVRPDSCTAEVMFGQDNIIGVLVKLDYAAGDQHWADTLNFQRTPTSWLLNNVFYEGGGNLRFRLFQQ